MRLFLHIRGATGSGKTTIVRQYLQKTGGFTLHKIKVNGKDYPYHYNKEKRILITGEYGRRVCDGCDGIITNKDLMRAYLIKLVDTVSPDIVIFEAVMYGLSATFALKLSEELKNRGYQYKGIVLNPPMEFCLSNIMTRNRGKKISINGLKSKCDQTRRSANKLIEAGLPCYFIDTSKYRVNQMSAIIEKELEHEIS